MCAKRWILSEIRVQKGGSSVVAHVQSWILKDGHADRWSSQAVNQTKDDLQHMQVS